MAGNKSQTIAFQSRVLLSARPTSTTQRIRGQQAWTVLTSKSDHHSLVFKKEPYAVEIHETRFSCDGSEKVSIKISLQNTRWRAAAFEEFPEGSGNVYVVLQPGDLPDIMVELAGDALAKYEGGGCLWDIAHIRGGHISIGIPNIHKVAGWNIECAKKCFGFFGPDSQSRLLVDNKLNDIVEHIVEAKMELDSVKAKVKMEEREATRSKLKLTYSNLPFKASKSKSDAGWKEWDKNNASVYRLKQQQNAIETYIWLGENEIRKEKRKSQGVFLGRNDAMMDEVSRERDGVVLDPGSRTVTSGSDSGKEDPGTSKGQSSSSRDEDGIKGEESTDSVKI